MSATNRLSVLNFVGVSISVVPLYGYHVHGSHDSQQIGLLVILAWAVTCFFVICFFVATMVKNNRGEESTITRNLTGYFILAGAFGYGGAHRAFFELIAG